LLLDIRPHNAYLTARIQRALSLSVPSMLLKRPNLSLARLAEMMPSSSDRAKFANWRTASRIVVYDADSTSLAMGSNLLGLLRKFRGEGFEREVAWLRGGFTAVWREQPGLVTQDPPPPEEDEEDASASVSMAKTMSAPASVGTFASNGHQMAFNPFFDTIRQNLELARGAQSHDSKGGSGNGQDGIALRLPRRVRRRERPSSESTSPTNSSAEDLTRALAMQFYKIELGEQKRLMGVMEHHSKESGVKKETFPYSITAGVEKGDKNRYRNIWPFEHARVRLMRRSSQEDDYMNASFVQPLGTTKRYIATQGPLPATFTDFWTLCWEQNVHVIVMLTREVESATVKCGNYWNEGEYGPLRLKLLETNDTPEKEKKRRESDKRRRRGGHDGKGNGNGEDENPTTIKRVFELRHTGYPLASPRIVTQLQYLEWPDLNVPEDPRGVLDLMWEVEEIVESSASSPGKEVDPRTGVAKHAVNNPPVLLHCSAGVGRTGGFIAVDAILDGIRREMRKRREEASRALRGEMACVWTVIEDMREQRMSLCQSLRQYVFVHRAIIE
ncbi:hypothetical protein K474DRAFT_1567419, partial [Panus rudis PR-1116 ss-1]